MGYSTAMKMNNPHAEARANLINIMLNERNQIQEYITHDSIYLMFKTK